MLFISLNFMVFFFVVYALFWALPTWRNMKTGITDRKFLLLCCTDVKSIYDGVLIDAENHILQRLLFYFHRTIHRLNLTLQATNCKILPATS